MIFHVDCVGMFGCGVFIFQFSFLIVGKLDTVFRNWGLITTSAAKKKPNQQCLATGAGFSEMVSLTVNFRLPISIEGIL